MRFFEVVEELDEFSPKTREIAYVSGFTNPEDGGGGFFIYTPNFSTKALAGFAHNTNSGSWIRKIQGEKISVQWFGAKADGVTDCTPALDSAVAVASGFYGGVSGATVWFPAGYYKFLTQPKPIGVGITLEGEGSIGTDANSGVFLSVDYQSTDDRFGFIDIRDSESMGISTVANSGGSIRKLRIDAAPGFEGSLISLTVGPEPMVDQGRGQIGFWHFDSLLLTCNGYARRALFLRDFEVSGIQRIRDIHVTNSIFAGASRAGGEVVFSGVTNAVLSGCLFFHNDVKPRFDAGVTLAGQNKPANYIWLSGIELERIKNSNSQSVYLNGNRVV